MNPCELCYVNVVFLPLMKPNMRNHFNWPANGVEAKIYFSEECVWVDGMYMYFSCKNLHSLPTDYPFIVRDCRHTAFEALCYQIFICTKVVYSIRVGSGPELGQPKAKRGWIFNWLSTHKLLGLFLEDPMKKNGPRPGLYQRNGSRTSPTKKGQRRLTRICKKWTIDL